MTIDRMECVVVGAGTAGAAIARRLAIAGHEVMLIARRDRIRTMATAVIPGAGWPEPVEAAVLDRPETLRAVLRARGSAALKSYCQLTSTPFAQTSQLVVARNADEWKLLCRTEIPDRQLAVHGQRHVELLDADAVLRLEPGLKCAGALLAGRGRHRRWRRPAPEPPHRC